MPAGSRSGASRTKAPIRLRQSAGASVPPDGFSVVGSKMEAYRHLSFIECESGSTATDRSRWDSNSFVQQGKFGFSRHPSRRTSGKSVGRGPDFVVAELHAVLIQKLRSR